VLSWPSQIPSSNSIRNSQSEILVIFDLWGVPTEDHETIREAAKATVMFPSAVYKGDFGSLDSIAERLTQNLRLLWHLIEVFSQSGVYAFLSGRNHKIISIF
jgi:spore coat polysaccharide biosynthesis predicted glycosyltransferase SpsG